MTRLNERGQHLVDGNGDSVHLCKGDNRLVEGVNFSYFPHLEVLKHAAGVACRPLQHLSELGLKHRLRWKRDAFHRCDLSGLTIDHHACIEQTALQQFTVGQPSQCSDGVDREVQHDLFPNQGGSIVMEPRICLLNKSHAPQK